MLSEQIEAYRDRKWRRESSLRIETVSDAESMIEDLGFCFGLTDIKKRMPSIFIAVCGRRDAVMPRNVQKDPEASASWVLKDEVMARGKVYYAKILKGRSWFVSRRLIPAFNTIWGCSRKAEAGVLSENARRVLLVLRKEWEMATADLRQECGFKDREALSKALDELQAKMKVVPQEAVYSPKFTYLWTLSEARFPDEFKVKMSREDAVLELARAYLTICGMTLDNEFAGKFGLNRSEAGIANKRLVEEGFADQIDTGIHRLAVL